MNDTPPPVLPAWKQKLRAMAAKSTPASSTHADRLPFFKVPDDGKPHRFRILPGWFGGLLDDKSSANCWYVEVFQHWVKDPKSDRNFDKGFVCRDHQHLGGEKVDGECAFCSARRSLQDSLQETSAPEQEVVKKKIKAMNYQVKFLVQGVDRLDGKLKLWNVPATAARQLHSAYANYQTEREEQIERDPGAGRDILSRLETNENDPEATKALIAYCDAFDADEGRDITVTRTTKDNRTEYTITMASVPSPVSRVLEDKKALMAARYDLETIIREELADESAGHAEEACNAALIRATSAAKRKPLSRNSDDLEFRGRGKEGKTFDDRDDNRLAESADVADSTEEGDDSGDDEDYIDMNPTSPTPPTTANTRDNVRNFKF